MRDVRIVNHTAGQQVESDKVLKRISEMFYRNMGTFAKIALFNSGKALITEGLRVVPNSNMTVTVELGSIIQRIPSGDMMPCIMIEDYDITMDAASGSPRIDIIECQIREVTDKDDVSMSVVDPVTGAITLESIKRDVKYYLFIQKQTGTTTATAGTIGTLTGTVAISTTIDLSTNYLLNLADGEDGSFQEIDLRGSVPTATTAAEIVANINAAVGRTMAAVISGNYIELTGVGTGITSKFEIKPPVSDSDADALQTVFGVSASGIYDYIYAGVNDFIKLCEIDIGASDTVITSGMIRDIDEKGTWASDGENIILKLRIYDSSIETITSSTQQLENNKEYLINYIGGKCTLTLPAFGSIGDTIKIRDIGTYGWTIAQNAGQNILLQNGKSTVSGVTGDIHSRIGGTAVELICVVADTTWKIVNLQDEWQMKGYYMGGSTGSPTAIIEDMNFSNETSSVISATLDTAKVDNIGVSGNTKGYCMGGTAGGAVAVIEDMNFFDETSSVITATLDTAKSGGAGVSGNTKGYCMGGNTGSLTAIIEDMNFSNETSSVISATLDTAKTNCDGVSGNTKGYCMGGNTGSYTAVIEDMNFSNETSSIISATLDTAKYSSSACVSGNMKGYYMGGNTGSYTAVIEDMNFSNETSSIISATLDTAKGNSAGVSGNTKGYCMGGNTGSYTAVIEDMNFSNETSSIISATLDTAKGAGVGVQGYIG